MPSTYVPAWARQAVFYQIYPLGFLGCPPRNDGHSQPVPRLARLRDWYGHFHDLGITAIYFGPVFESLSHGYDTTDYMTIDRRLGTNDLFRQIVDELHGLGIRVILDGVFNHVGREFFSFQGVRRERERSPYCAWHCRLDFARDSGLGDGFDYEGWEGHKHLVRLNLGEPAVREHLFAAARYWLGEVGIDGWRLDVAYLIDPGFWGEFRRVCRAVQPESFTVGELVHGDYRRWVGPAALDSGTNYQLYKPLWSALNSHNLWELKAELERQLHPEWGLYKDLRLFSFLGNHDVTRIRSLLADERHLHVALIALLTLPGIPCLYYGDEIGLTGRVEPGSDAAVRRPMPAPGEPWPRNGEAILATTRRLIALRRAHPALWEGDLCVLGVGPRNDTLSYLRRGPGEIALVVLNSGDDVRCLEIALGPAGVPEGALFIDLLDEAHPGYRVTGGRLTLPAVYPGWGRVLVWRAG